MPSKGQPGEVKTDEVRAGKLQWSSAKNKTKKE